MESSILVTGGSGFIGSNFIRTWLEESRGLIVNLDKRTYAAAPNSTSELDRVERDCFVLGDIGNRELVRGLLSEHRPSAVINFAAETHVDRSILFPTEFVQTNVVGTFNLLDEVRHYWMGLTDSGKATFRFLQVSTDEVYGTLASEDLPWRENMPLAPNSPYAASKAAADHIVRSYHQTYGLPALITRGCNNYGPCQYPEKLIPFVIFRALRNEPLPMYGDGNQIRDWLYVRDHCLALQRVLASGRPGEIYNISAKAERTNLQVVRAICAMLDDARPRRSGMYAELIEHVSDRPAHDRRYAIDSSKLSGELHWRASESFESGLEKTVKWYLDHLEWMTAVTGGEKYTDWLTANYQRRR